MDIEIKENDFFTDANKRSNKSEVAKIEDSDLKIEIDSLVDSLRLDDADIVEDSAQKLLKHCQSGVSTVAQLPTYFRFLFNRLEEIKIIHDDWKEDAIYSRIIANVISVLSITENDELDCISYRLIGLNDDINLYGIEYVRHLCEEIKIHYERNLNTYDGNGSSTLTPAFFELAKEICNYYVHNNYEIEAVDLFLDLDFHERLDEFIDEKNVAKICRYLQQCSYFCAKDDYLELNRFLYGTYQRYIYIPESFMAACRCLDVEFFHDLLLKVVDECVIYNLKRPIGLQLQQQLCYILGHYGIYYIFSEECEFDTKCDCDKLFETIHNSYLLKAHSDLATELDILKPYSPDDIYKTNSQKFSTYISSGNAADPIRTNMGSAFTSGLINAAFKTDTVLQPDNTHKFLLSQKETPLLNSVACLGLLYMWDVEDIMLVTDKFLNNADRYIQAGAILAIGIASANVCDPFLSHFAVVSEYFYQPDLLLKRCAIMAVGLAYAGTDDPDVIDNLKDIMCSDTNDFHTKAYSALSIGVIACGSNNPSSVYGTFIDILSAVKDKLSLSDPFLRLIPVGLVLAYVGRYEVVSSEAKEITKFPGDFGKWCFLLLKICSNMGTGNTIAIQKIVEYIYDAAPTTETPTDKPVQPEKSSEAEPLLEQEQSLKNDDKAETATPPEEAKIQSEIISPKIDEHKFITEAEKIQYIANLEEKMKFLTKVSNLTSHNRSGKKREIKKLRDETTATEMLQGLATIGVAFISLNEEVSQAMVLRLYNSFLQFGSYAVKRAVPIGLGILYASNPQVSIIDLLSKLSHDSDESLSCNAILALGMVGAGTNSSRIANLLRNLNVYFCRNPPHLFAIRLSQGLVYLSKGLMTISPIRAEGTFLAPVSLASLFIHSIMCLDIKNTYLSMDPRMFFWLVPAMKLRALITYDENMKIVPVTVRVGQAVEEIGQAGKPKRITGFQTHRTPILLNVGDRVELATDRCIT
ncbi:hypothetical protein HZS_2007 [Henneguya salminicola]|nr:hypothetical protein HZS_2007 [Henneguya salminicola]